MNLFEEERRTPRRDVDEALNCPQVIAWREKLKELATRFKASCPPEPDRAPARHIPLPGIMSD